MEGWFWRRLSIAPLKNKYSEIRLKYIKKIKTEKEVNEMKRLLLVLVILLVTLFFTTGCITSFMGINDVDVPQIMGPSILPAEEVPSGPLVDELPEIVSQVTQVLEQDRPSMPDSSETELGDIWIGPSGTVYVYTQISLTQEQLEYLNLINVKCTGEWVPQ